MFPVTTFNQWLVTMNKGDRLSTYLAKNEGINYEKLGRLNELGMRR